MRNFLINLHLSKVDKVFTQIEKLIDSLIKSIGFLEEQSEAIDEKILELEWQQVNIDKKITKQTKLKEQLAKLDL